MSDILAPVKPLYQVSRLFGTITRSRSLWMNLLWDVIKEGAILPKYLREPRQLSTPLIEQLVRRLTTLIPKWHTTWELSYPTTMARLDIPLSITWLRLVAGNWLFVAASNDFESQIICYNLSGGGDTSRAYLPERVRTGKAEMKDGQVFIALGLGPELPAVRILTLNKKNRFVELACLEGSTHVLFFDGDIVGCAVQDGLNIPHLYDWKQHMVIEVSPPPGGLDIPSRRSVPHFMTIWNNEMVIIRVDCIELYSMPLPSTKSEVITFVEIIETSPIWEVDICSPAQAEPAALHLVVISPDGIELIVLRQLESRTQLERSLLVVTPPLPEPFDQEEYLGPEEDYPFLFGLHVGASGRRMIWVSAVEASVRSRRHPLRLLQAPITFTELDYTQQMSTFFDDSDPALWGAACMDFDDALGLVVIGNTFGELSVFDYGADRPTKYDRLSIDLVDVLDPDPLLLPLEKIPVGLHPPQVNPIEKLSDRCALFEWGKFDIGLSHMWTLADYAHGKHHFSGQDLLLGTPCDDAWLLEHAYGFPGPVIVQAYSLNEEAPREDIMFRIGSRYFCRLGLVSKDFFSWPLDETEYWTSYDFQGTSDPHPPTCPTALTVRFFFVQFYIRETERRDRWEDLLERGGQPPVGGCPRFRYIL
ncbi:hypothetical protein MIND_01196300 [Mycena indigotica]|uniref:Uncharacterized protein n=1 Tax=Mycena indigotica TaxID=2126181 RepID=A0A8H6S528_9AGAR|nr:uncharacterized protein MIND_01196300 [Mycena indigotica]KAF7292971.1 hypothetical protein MIND_01196300 [Mycena indigotica]